MKKLILASASPRRRELLTQIHLPFEVMVSEAEEKTEAEEPAAVVEQLSVQKCMEVAGRLKEDAVVLAADTVVAVDGRILGKPKDEEDALAMLRLIQGRTHQVYTGVTIWDRGEGCTAERETFSVCTDVTLFPMTEQEMTEYIRTGEPMDKAGAYGIQGCFARYVRKINGDYHTVVGLPVSEVYQRLKRMLGEPELKRLTGRQGGDKK